MRPEDKKPEKTDAEKPKELTKEQRESFRRMSFMYKTHEEFMDDVLAGVV